MSSVGVFDVKKIQVSEERERKKKSKCGRGGKKM